MDKEFPFDHNEIKKLRVVWVKNLKILVRELRKMADILEKEIESPYMPQPKAILVDRILGGDWSVLEELKNGKTNPKRT